MAVILKQKGNFLENFRLGQVFRHKVGKTLTEGLFNAFTEFAMTTNPLSKNRRYAERYGFRDMIAPPGLVMSIVFSQSVEDISENARANLEYLNMRFGAPVYIGDTIEVTSIVLGIRASKSEPDRGVVHVQTTGRNQRDEVVLTYERKVQVWKRDPDADVQEGKIDAVPEVACELWLPEYNRRQGYADLAHLTNADTYFEDFTPGDVIEHWRGRVMTTEHVALTAMLDNTSQVHCNQFMIDQQPEKFLGGQLIVFGGLPFNLCLGLSCPDIADNALGDLIYTSGRHTAPVFAGDTVFAATEICGTRDYPRRADLGVLATILRGHKFVRLDGKADKIEIFSLERQIAVKRRSHYC
jgi:2-methylfumaryl-CoA hydratase